MKLFKKSERKIRTADMINTWKVVGCHVKNLGEYKRWVELEDGKVSVSMTIYEAKAEGMPTGYFLSDSLGRVACQTVLDKQEIMNWLKEHGYKTDKEFYMEDMGMDEETWEEWNK